MKEKTIVLLFAIFQIALSAIMLLLATTWIGFHLFAGHFNLLGFAVAMFILYILVRMLVGVIKEYKQDKKSFN